MPKSYIVLRHSPDWLSYDEEQSRVFLRAQKLPETLIVDFMSIWDQAMAVDYRHFRHAMKTIAVETFRAAVDATFVTLPEFRAIVPEPDDLIVFTDDDDWLAPDLFVRLRANEFPADGMSWGSIRLGPAIAGEVGGLSRRPINRHIYTNNAAVSGRVVARLGIDAIVDHTVLMAQRQSGAFAADTLPLYLSLANKHPCSTMVVAFYSMPHDDFRDDPKAKMADFAEMLATAHSQAGAEWFAAPLAKLQSLMHAALGPA